MSDALVPEDPQQGWLALGRLAGQQHHRRRQGVAVGDPAGGNQRHQFLATDPQQMLHFTIGGGGLLLGNLHLAHRHRAGDQRRVAVQQAQFANVRRLPAGFLQQFAGRGVNGTFPGIDGAAGNSMDWPPMARRLRLTSISRPSARVGTATTPFTARGSLMMK